MPRLVRCLLLVTALTGLAGCATTQFFPYEGRDNVYPGKGGSRFTQEGIDVWFNGEPAHKYAILGYIDDNIGLYGDETHRSVDSRVIKKAREIGADGLIETTIAARSNTPSSGIMFGGGSRGVGMGFGFGMPLNERSSVKYTAVKYLD